MPNGPRIRSNNLLGRISSDISAVSSTFNSPALVDFPAINDAHAVITLDPLKQYGNPEIVIVTNHPASSTVATIERGAYGSMARSHPADTVWIHAPVNEDLTHITTSTDRPDDPYEGQLIYETDTDDLMAFNGLIWVSLINLPSGGTIEVVTSSTRPGSPYDGQVIYETDTDSVAAYNGTSWKYLNIRVVTSGTRPPTPFEGQVIYETDTDNVVVYNGTAWKYVSGILTVTSSTRPSSPYQGQVIYETDTDDFKYWDGDSWEDFGGGGGGGVEIPQQDTAPAAPEEDDLWIDTDDDLWPAGMPGTTLAYAQTITSQSVTTETDITGLSVTVTVPEGRRLKVTVSSNLTTATAGARILGQIYQDGVVVGRWVDRDNASSTTFHYSASSSAIVTPSAGTHTYKATLQGIGGGVGTEASAFQPAYILVEDITGSSLPYDPASIPVGTLGFAQRFSNQTGIGTTPVLIGGLSVNVSVPAGRQLKITGFLPTFTKTSGAPTWVRANLRRNGVEVQRTIESVTNDTLTSLAIEHTESPPAGSHVYELYVDTDTGTLALDLGSVGSGANAFIIVEDVTATPASGAGAPGSTLGYAQSVANSPNIGTTETDLTGLSVTVTVPEGRRLRITGFTEIIGDTADQRVFLRIREGATQLQLAAAAIRATGTTSETLQPSVVVTPSAGTHTYKLSLQTSTGLAATSNATSQPAYILVEDITGAIWPADAVPQHTVLGTTTLGYAEVTTNQTGISTIADLNGLSVTVNVPAGRRIKISGQIQLVSASTSGTCALYIREGSTTLQTSQENYNTIGGNGKYVDGSVIITPSAGPHTYKLSASGTAGTVDLIVGAGVPAFILVEDITGVADPFQPESVPVGLLGRALKVSDQGSITGTSTITDLSVNVSVPAGRTLRVNALLDIHATVDGAVPIANILQDGVVVGRATLELGDATGRSFTLAPSVILSPTAGAHVYTVQVVNALGGSTLTVTAAADRPSYLTVEDITPTPSPSEGAPGSTLAYNQVTAYQTPITTEVDLTGLTATVTVPAGRRLRVTGHIGYSRTVADGLVRLAIKEGATFLQLRDQGSDHAGQGANELTASVIITPSAGTHTYKLSLQLLTGSGNTELVAGPTFPSYIIVEDITGSVWPEGTAVTTGMVVSQPWIDYIPSHNDITVGNGIQTAAYMKIGRTVHVRLTLILGTTSAIGADPRVGLPFTARVATGLRHVGALNLLDSGVRNFVGISLIHESDANRAYLLHSEAGNAGTVNATNPFTWASTDTIVMSMTYEATS